MVYRCDSCSAPIFLKFAVKMYAANRVELANNFVELERAREKFNFTYLPEDVERLFREALGCYSAGFFNAFASMCRRTAQAVFQDLGDNGRLRIFEQVREARDLAEIDDETFAVVKKVLFGADADPNPQLPELGASEAGVLLELVKDMLYEAYVRKGKLQQAMMVRRFFAEETLDKITPIGRAASAIVSSGRVWSASSAARCQRFLLTLATSTDPFLPHPDPRVAEHPHPAAVLAPVFGMPGILHGAEDALRVRHQDRHAAVGRREPGDPGGRAVRVRRVRRRRRGRGCRPSAGSRGRPSAQARSAAASANSARPSPCATAIGSTEPSMPRKKIDGVGSTSTSPTRPSNCSERLRTKRGQCAAPGISDFSADIIWQPLQTPSEKLSRPREERLELLAQRGVEQDRLRPALAGAEHVAVREPAAGDQPLEAIERDAAGDEVGHVHVGGPEAGAVEHRGHLDLAVDALLAQDRDLGSRAARHVRRGDVLRRVVRQVREQARVLRVDRALVLFLGAGRVVAQRLHAGSSFRTTRCAVPCAWCRAATLPVASAIATRSIASTDAEVVHAAGRAPRPRSTARTSSMRAVCTCTTAPSSSANSSATAASRVDDASRTSSPQWPANAISASVASSPPSERS